MNKEIKTGAIPRGVGSTPVIKAIDYKYKVKGGIECLERCPLFKDIMIGSDYCSKLCNHQQKATETTIRCIPVTKMIHNKKNN